MKGDSSEDCRIEYLVDPEAIDALTEKMLGVTESLLADVEAKDSQDSLASSSLTTWSSAVGLDVGSFKAPGEAVRDRRRPAAIRVESSALLAAMFPLGVPDEM